MFLNKEQEIFITTDIDMEHIKLINKKLKPNPNFKAFLYDISKDYKKLSKYKFDTIICINILEHVKNDRKMLNNFSKLLDTNGKLILFAPAIKSLYGSIDKADGHFRRYSKKELVAKLKESGFIIKKLFYFNFIGIFGWYLHSKILRLNIHRDKDLSMFNKIIPFISFIEKIIPPPIGLSLVSICGKKQLIPDWIKGKD